MFVGCLLTGSSVIVKVGGRYLETYVSKIYRSTKEFKVTASGYKGKRFSIRDAVLDETPDPAKLTRYTKGVFRASDLNDVRLVKSPEFCLL